MHANDSLVHIFDLVICLSTIQSVLPHGGLVISSRYYLLYKESPVDMVLIHSEMNITYNL